jgi:hypothetical protein
MFAQKIQSIRPHTRQLAQPMLLTPLLLASVAAAAADCWRLHVHAIEPIVYTLGVLMCTRAAGSTELRVSRQPPVVPGAHYPHLRLTEGRLNDGNCRRLIVYDSGVARQYLSTGVRLIYFVCLSLYLTW